MSNITIYVPDGLDMDVRAHRVPISATCQAALRRAVKRAEIAVMPTEHDDTQFIAQMLVRGLDDDQVARLIAVLSELNE